MSDRPISPEASWLARLRDEPGVRDTWIGPDGAVVLTASPIGECETIRGMRSRGVTLKIVWIVDITDENPLLRAVMERLLDLGRQVARNKVPMALCLKESYLIVETDDIGSLDLTVRMKGDKIGAVVAIAEQSLVHFGSVAIELEALRIELDPGDNSERITSQLLAELLD
jgi:hypothetical protein